MAVTAPPVITRQSPYRGLVPFSEEDAGFFFGRDRERQIIIANLLASRLTVVYGASGVGKSSLLRAGVVHKLRIQARQAVSAGEAPEFVVVEFSSWRDHPVAGLNKAIERSVAEVFGRETAPLLSDEPPEEVDALLRAWTDTIGADLLILLDQFEEFFFYQGPNIESNGFALGFANAVNDPTLPVNFLVAIREDAHALLDQFKGLIHGNVFGNNLRIEHLDADAARQAIVKPLERYNDFLEGDEISIEPELVETVLEEVRTGKVSLGRAGESGFNTRDYGPVRVEAPYLQLVMSRLWDEERRAGSRLLRMATLERLGGAERIVHSHLDEAMADLTPEQRDLATRIFRFLVTPGGTKIAHVADDLAQYVGVSVSETEGVLQELDRVRIVRSVDPPAGEMDQRYEIYHDVLAEGILEWRRKREASESVRRVRRRAAAVLAGALGLILVLIVGFILIDRQRDLAEEQRALAEEQRDFAEDQRALAQARLLSVEAREALERNPEDGVRLAIESIDMRRTSEAENLLRRAFSELRTISVVDDHDGVVWNASFSPDGRFLVSAGQDGRAVVAGAETGDPVSILEGHDGDLTGAMFTHDGKRVVTAGTDGTARLWDTSTGEEIVVLQHPDEAYQAQHERGVYPRDLLKVSTSGPGTVSGDGDRIPTGALSDDGRYLVTIGGDSAWIWDLTGGELIARLQHPAQENWPAVITSASFSPDGQSILTAAQDGIVRLWDTAGFLVSQIANEADSGVIGVNTAVYDPQGGQVAFGDQHGSLVLWEPGSEEEPIRIEAFNGPIYQITFSSDGNLVLATGSLSWRTYHWTGDFVAESEIRGDFVSSARFSPDSRHVITAAHDGLARVMDAESGNELLTLGGHENIVWSAEFDQGGDRVVTASEDGTARVWRLGLGVPLPDHDVWINTVQFSPDGDRVLTAGGDGRAYVSSGADGSVVRELETEEAGFLYNWVASFDETGERVIVASQESGIVRIWSLDDGQMLECCETGFRIFGTALPPGRPELAVVLDSGSSLTFWDLTASSGASPIHEIESVQNAVFASDGTFFITVDRDEGLARRWDLSTFEEVGQWEVGLVQSWELSSDDRSLVVLDGGGWVKVWNIPSESDAPVDEPELVFNVRAGRARVLALSEDGRRIVTGGSDGSVWVWDASTGRPLGQTVPHSAAVNSVDIAEDGRIASAANDGARISSCRACGPIGEIEEEARRRLAALDS